MLTAPWDVGLPWHLKELADIYAMNHLIIKSALLLNEIHIKPVLRYNIESYNRTFIVWFSRKMCIAKPLNQTAAFDLLP